MVPVTCFVLFCFLLLLLLLLFHKGYDESEYSTFSAANCKNYKQTLFFSLFDFFLNYCQLATEIQHLLKRERLKNYFTFMDWWQAAPCPLTTTILFPISSSAPTLLVVKDASYIHKENPNWDSFVLLFVVGLISRPLRRFRQPFHSLKRRNDNDLLLTIHLRSDKQLLNTSSRT